MRQADRMSDPFVVHHAVRAAVRHPPAVAADQAPAHTAIGLIQRPRPARRGPGEVPVVDDLSLELAVRQPQPREVVQFALVDVAQHQQDREGPVLRLPEAEPRLDLAQRLKEDEVGISGPEGATSPCPK